tara:strand:+ start:1642 stop:2883 length:1242 start_codon:yes stop_codon:yes gene_type:complete
MFLNILKKIARNIPFSGITYLFLNRFLNRKFFYSSIFNKDETITKFSVDNHHIFFGYYDITPFNKDNTKLLAVKTKNETNTLAEIGYFYLNQPDKFISLGSTKSWCWQQAARLRWFDENSKSLISYNSIKDGKYINVIKNIETKKIERLISFPLYDISSDKSIGLSLNFSRLQRLRPGYGYSNIDDFTINDACPDNDGIYLVNLNFNKASLTISYSNLLKEFPLNKQFNNTQHYFNHLSFNPSGDKFLFFHLMQHDSGRTNRLFVFNIKTKKTLLLEDNLIVSHYTWRDDKNILITAFDTITKKTSYIVYNTEKNSKEFMSNPLLNRDGHPSFTLNKKYIVSDTYPDINNNQELFYYDILNDKYHTIGSFYKRYKYQGENRCDLHPRLSNDSNYISFDSTHSGLRSQYIIKFN